MYADRTKWDAKQELSKWLPVMDKRRVSYSFFDDSKSPLPMMRYKGDVVTGSGNIRRAMDGFFSEQTKPGTRPRKVMSRR